MTEPVQSTDSRTRLAAAAAAFAALRPAVEARDPWPLSPEYGSEPESDWGPKELLAHTAEMLDYWQIEIDRILHGGPDPIPFGRVATDRGRIERIGRDRELQTGELFDRIAAETARLDARLGSTPATDVARRGVHPRLGEMSISDVVNRFLVGHLEEHADQLRAILASRPSGIDGPG